MTRDECAKAAYDAAARVLRKQGETVSPWCVVKEGFPDVREVWLAGADAIGPRCWRKVSPPGDGRMASEYQCTLPTWHDREVEKCR